MSESLAVVVPVNKIVVMQDGYIEQVGTPLDLYDRPANRFVAGFIGSPSMNMIPGVMGANGALDLGGTVLTVNGATEGQKVIFGIRPEHLELAQDGLPVTVSVVEPTGSETHVICRFGETELTAVFRERHAFTPGQTIHLQPMPDHTYLFDAETGKILD